MTDVRWRTEAPKPTGAQLAEIKRLEANTQQSRKLAEESFQRSDTDGFLSQWAHNIGADLDRAKIDILKNGGYARFPVLCDEAGNVVADRLYTFPNQFASWRTVQKWKLPNELAERHGRRWVPRASYRGKSRIQKQLGLHEDERWFPAFAKITTGGRKSTGLSGCANAFVGTFKVGEDPED